jgi:hypothetical protein
LTVKVHEFEAWQLLAVLETVTVYVVVKEGVGDNVGLATFEFERPVVGNQEYE